MNSISRLFLALCLVLASGCAKSLVVSDTAGGPIARGVPVYVAVAEDGRHEDKVHEGSGLLASVAVAESLEPYTTDRIIGLAKETQDEALASARRTNSAYLVYPRIVRWVDRAAISAKPEAAEVHVSVVEAATGRTVNTAQLVGQGQIVLRPSTPSEQLVAPLNEWAAKAFAAQAE